jgi:pimeloyl-ACP methyl ester carboxylesterase
VAAHCALIRPDVFRSVVMMSAPFAGAPDPEPRPSPVGGDIQAGLARLTPPRKHYQWYFSSQAAQPDLMAAPQGLHAFLRAYYHAKSADWVGNRPERLASWRAEDLAGLPDYYVMPFAATMPEAVAPCMPSAAEIAACRWLPDAELAVYVREFARTGFQGGLNWYRCATTGLVARDLRLFAGRKIEVPAAYVAGVADWGIYQSPGAFEAMQSRACGRFLGMELIPGAGHWVQQEQPEATVKALLRFLRS